MKKKLSVFILLIMTAALMLSMSTAAYAQSPSIEYKGQSAGLAFAPGSEYTDTDLFSAFKNVVPGDKITDSIRFTNTAADCDYVVLFMRVLDHSPANPLSENVAALTDLDSSKEFLDMLTLTVAVDGGAEVYSGPASGNSGYVQIGSFARNQGADIKVTLTVPKEADNDFADKLGEVDFVFQVQAFHAAQLTVNKVWSDGNWNHASEGVTVELLRTANGITTVDRTVELSAANSWTYTFSGLDTDYAWDVREASAPQGYGVSYSRVGNQVTITNTNGEGKLPLDLTVSKRWDASGHECPNFVTVGLYDGDMLIDTQTLNADNYWQYRWYDPGRLGNWSVKELNIPQNFTPTYMPTVSGVVITNTYKLVQSGQLNWPVAVMGVMGAALIAGGIVLASKKKKENEA